MEMPKAYQGKEPYIFVSYAHADAEQVLPAAKSAPTSTGSRASTNSP